MIARLAVVLCVALATSLCSAQYYGRRVPTPGMDRAATTAPGEIRIDQKLGESVPLDAVLTRDGGEVITLREAIGSKPTILMLVFYKCAGICTDQFNNLTNTLEGIRTKDAGVDFRVVVVSIDPRETVDLAENKKAQQLQVYGDRGDPNGWVFSVAEQPEIKRIADAVGYRYRYEQSSGNIVHPAGIVILSPNGQISRYFLGTEYPGQMLVDSLTLAARGGLGALDRRPFFLACINIDPLTGERTLNILNTVKTAGLLTMIGLAVSVFALSRKKKAVS